MVRELGPAGDRQAANDARILGWSDLALFKKWTHSCQSDIFYKFNSQKSASLGRAYFF